MNLKRETVRNESLYQQDQLWTKSFIMLTLCYFLLYICLQILLAPLPSYAKEQFQPSDFMVSMVTSVFAASAIAARFLTAALMRKVHRNILLFAGILISAVATAAYPFADTLWVLLALRACFGIGFGIGSTIMPTLAVELIPLRRIGEGIGYFGLSTSLALSLGPMIGLMILSSYGIEPLTMLGTAAAVVIIPLLLASRSIPPQKNSTKPAASQTAKEAATPFNKAILLPAGLNALLSVTYGGLLSFLALFGKEMHLANVGVFFLVNAVTILIIRPISGRLFDERGHAAVLIPAPLFVIAGLILISYSTTMPILCLSAFLYGIGFGAIQPSLQAWMLHDSAPEHHGTANSLFYNAIDVGVALGSLALGAIASVYGSYAVMYRYAAIFMGVFLILYCGGQLAGSRRRAAADLAAPMVAED